MRKIVILLAAAALIVSCGQKKKTVTGDLDVSMNVKDSLVLVAGEGPVIEKLFEGMIPAADTPGQTLVLKLYQ